MQISIEIIAATISAVALIISFLSALFSYRLQSSSSRRSSREQLRDVVNEAVKITSEYNALSAIPPNSHDLEYYQKSSYYVTSSVGLSRQCEFLIDENPDLVTDFEYLIVAQLLCMASNFSLADQYYKKGIEIAPNDFYRIVNMRSYASFLFSQGRQEDGRNNYQSALRILKNDTDYGKNTNAFTHQMWMVSEIYNSSFEEAERQHKQGKVLAESISNERVKEGMLASLNNASQFAKPASQPLKPLEYPSSAHHPERLKLQDVGE